MSLKLSLAKNYLARLKAFDFENGSVGDLESARRFVRWYTGKGSGEEFGEIVKEVHDLLESIIESSLLDPTLKSAYIDLARRYDTENVLVANRTAPSAPEIAPERLRLVGDSYNYDPSIYASSNPKTRPGHQDLSGGPGGYPGGGSGSRSGSEGDQEEGHQEAVG